MPESTVPARFHRVIRTPPRGVSQEPARAARASQKQIRKLIAGRGVYIWDECIEKADRVIATGEVTATPLSAMEPAGEGTGAATTKCTFCGKRRHQVSGVAAAARAAICDECLALCHEIITEELG